MNLVFQGAVSAKIMCITRNLYNLILVLLTILLVLTNFPVLNVYVWFILFILAVIGRIIIEFIYLNHDTGLEIIRYKNIFPDRKETALINRIYIAFNACKTNKYHVLIGLFAYLSFLLVYGEKLSFLLKPECIFMASVIWVFLALHNILNYISYAAVIHYVEGSHKYTYKDSENGYLGDDKYKYEWKYASNELFFFAIIIFLTTLFMASPIIDKLNGYKFPGSQAVKTTEKAKNENKINQKIKVTLIIPKFYNDKKPVPQDVITGIESEIVNISGGLTVFSGNGKWEDQSNKLKEDQNYIYLITTTPDKLPKLKKLVKQIKKYLNQQEIYFDYSEVINKNL